MSTILLSDAPYQPEPDQSEQNRSQSKQRSTWNAERDEVVRAAALAGQTAKQAGDLLGISRNAVLGRAFRIGAKFAGPHSNQHRAAAALDRDPDHKSRWVNGKRRRKTASATPSNNPFGHNQRRRKYSDLLPPMTGTLPLAEVVELLPATTLFEDLKPGQCHFPKGDCAPFLFCDADAIPGLPSPYCAAHWRRSRGYQSSPRVSEEERERRRNAWQNGEAA